MILGYLNAEVNLECVGLFCETYDVSGLIKVPTCFKVPEKPSLQPHHVNFTLKRRRNWNEFCNEKRHNG